MPNIACPSTNAGVTCRRSASSGVNRWVEVAGGWDAEIEREWGFGRTKPKTERNALGIGLVLKRTAGTVVESHGVRGKG
jgi:hypothetical protein